MKLYKYTTWHSFNTHCTFDNNCRLLQKCYNRDNLLHSQLYFNSTTSFNDPFDLYPYLDIDCSYSDLKRFSINVVMRDENRSRKSATKLAARRIKELGLLEKKVREERKQLIRNKITNIGVCCFTTNFPETLLMWAHYAESHTGICLEFDCPDEGLFIDKSEFFIGPIPVIYDDKLPLIKLLNPTTLEDDLLCCLRTKSKEWKYEKEFRALRRNYIGTRKYKPWLLNAIYAGCKMHDQEFEELQKTVKQIKFRPDLYRMQKKEQEFGLKVIKIDL